MKKGGQSAAFFCIVIAARGNMTEPIHTILSRFPGPVRLRSSPRKWFWILIGSALFTAVGYVMIHTPRVTADTFQYAVAVSGICFFGVCALVSVASLLPGSGALTLDGDGFTMRSLFRSHRCSWRQVSEFGVIDIGATVGHPAPRRMGRAEFVAFDDSKATGRLADWARQTTGRSGMLPDTYGLDCQSLATLLNAWRARAIGARQPAEMHGPWG